MRSHNLSADERGFAERPQTRRVGHRAARGQFAHQCVGQASGDLDPPAGVFTQRTGPPDAGRKGRTLGFRRRQFQFEFARARHGHQQNVRGRFTAQRTHH